jgi:hypothetical protein
MWALQVTAGVSERSLSMRVSKLMVALTAVLCVAGTAVAEDGADEHEAMMMEWMEKYATPGKEHDYFKFFVGQWEFENTSYMMGEPTMTPGMAAFELIMGGRYLSASHSGESGGMPFEGMGLSGFDRTTGECFNYWLDNHGTGVMESRGKIDEDGKGDLTVGANNSSPWGPTTWRMVTDITGDDTFTFTMYMASMGEPENKVMEIKYKRVKAS